MNGPGIVWLLKSLFILYMHIQKAKTINATKQMLMSALVLWCVVKKARHEGAMRGSSGLHAGTTNDTYCKDIKYIR